MSTMKRTFIVEGWEKDWKIELFPSPETLIDQGREEIRASIAIAATQYEKTKSFTDKDCTIEEWIRNSDREQLIDDFKYDMAPIVMEAIADLNDITYEETIEIIFDMYQWDEDFRNVVHDICNEIWLVLAKEPVGII
jgi:hypothetical protein